LAARFSFRFFWADFLEALPPPLSLLAMRAIYRIREESARPLSGPRVTRRRDRQLKAPVDDLRSHLEQEGMAASAADCWPTGGMTDG
jgi:hypothetical protein